MDVVGENLADRFAVVADYYGLSAAELQGLARLDQSERNPLCRRMSVCPYVIRTMLDYDRYPQANDLYEILRRFGEDFARISVLDFGCLVADYAIFFARLGASVSIYDDAEAVKFAAYRLEREGLKFEAYTIPTVGRRLMSGKDVVVFGEVLEHIENPLLHLEDCIRERVRYIFTTCYPFGDDDYFRLSGHLASAQERQSDFIRLAMKHYDIYPLRDKTVLWKRRAASSEAG